jgi:hypothetical protein
MKKPVLGITLILLIACFSILEFSISRVKAESGIISESPSTEFIDYNNGTRQIIVDYGNGTQDYVEETLTRKTAELRIPNSTLNQPLLTSLPTSIKESTDYINTTQTLISEQEVLLGFTYELLYFRKEWNRTGQFYWIEWYVGVGVNIDIRFGLRLPFNVTLEYPEQMTVGHNYTLYATLSPIDKPDFDEFVFVFKANIWAKASIHVFGLGMDVWQTLQGPDLDKSQSFTTPLGPEAKAPLLSLDVNIFDLIKIVLPELSSTLDTISHWVFTPYLVLEPNFGSEKITAKAVTTGDSRVIEGVDLLWSMPKQRLNFTVQADEYDPTTNYTKIALTDFKYYFTKLTLDFKLRFDLSDKLNGFPLRLPDPPLLNITTVDLNWLIRWLGCPYLKMPSEYPRRVHVTIYVDRVIPPSEEIEPRDIGLLYGIVDPDIILAGQIVNITVVAVNLGNLTENFNVTIRYDNVTIEIYPTINLAPSEGISLVFSWNTTGLLPGHVYTIQAEASAVPNEIDKDDNILTVGKVKVKMLGDINRDEHVGIDDIVTAGEYFGESPGSPRWHPDIDMNLDNYIGIDDMVLIASHFGQTCP